MDIDAEIWRRHLVSGKTISAIARSLKLSRSTVRKHLRTTAELLYYASNSPRPSWGASHAPSLAQHRAALTQGAAAHGAPAL
ncbi:hypothetical protein D3C71_1774520 [compost metagenome]